MKSLLQTLWRDRARRKTEESCKILDRSTAECMNEPTNHIDIATHHTHESTSSISMEERESGAPHQRSASCPPFLQQQQTADQPSPQSLRRGRKPSSKDEPSNSKTTTRNHPARASVPVDRTRCAHQPPHRHRKTRNDQQPPRVLRRLRLNGPSPPLQRGTRRSLPRTTAPPEKERTNPSTGKAKSPTTSPPRSQSKGDLDVTLSNRERRISTINNNIKQWNTKKTPEMSNKTFSLPRNAKKTPETSTFRFAEDRRPSKRSSVMYFEPTTHSRTSSMHRRQSSPYMVGCCYQKCVVSNS